MFSHDLVSESSPTWGKAAQQPWGQGGLPPASCLPKGVELCPVSSWKKLWEGFCVAICCSHRDKSSEEQTGSSGGYVLSRQVFLFMVATGCSCNLLTILESVCFFKLSHSLPSWAFFYRLLSETEPFACQLLMIIWLSFLPCFSKASRNSPNCLSPSLPPLTSLLNLGSSKHPASGWFGCASW